MPLQAEASPERYRAVLDSVFATEPYQWSPPPALLQLLSEWWDRLITWLDGLRMDNPLLFRILFAAILLVWLGILAHAGWLVWRTIRGAAHSERAPVSGREGELRDADWYSRAADRAAEAGRLTEALQLAVVALPQTPETAGLLT